MFPNTPTMMSKGEFLEREKRDIEKLVALPLLEFDRMGLILVYLGEKPATSIGDLSTPHPFLL